MFHKHIKSLLNSNAMLLKAITYDRMYNLYRASANVVILGVVEAERLNNHSKNNNSLERSYVKKFTSLPMVIEPMTRSLTDTMCPLGTLPYNNPWNMKPLETSRWG
jgi:hypothetical protein